MPQRALVFVFKFSIVLDGLSASTEAGSVLSPWLATAFNVDIGFTNESMEGDGDGNIRQPSLLWIFDRRNPFVASGYCKVRCNYHQADSANNNAANNPTFFVCHRFSKEQVIATAF